jgi:hypothetical protein
MLPRRTPAVPCSEERFAKPGWVAAQEKQNPAWARNPTRRARRWRAVSDLGAALTRCWAGALSEEAPSKKQQRRVAEPVLESKGSREMRGPSHGAPSLLAWCACGCKHQTRASAQPQTWKTGQLGAPLGPAFAGAKVCARLGLERRISTNKFTAVRTGLFVVGRPTIRASRRQVDSGPIARPRGKQLPPSSA